MKKYMPRKVWKGHQCQASIAVELGGPFCQHMDEPSFAALCLQGMLSCPEGLRTLLWGFMETSLHEHKCCKWDRETMKACGRFSSFLNGSDADPLEGSAFISLKIELFM